MRDGRRRLRRAWTCDCSGDHPIGRENPEMTATVRQAIKTMTGTHVDVCPWKAFKDPFVARVIDAMRFFESGQLSFRVPNPSHRLVEGIAYYHSVDNRVYGAILDRERADRKREQERQQMLARAGRG